MNCAEDKRLQRVYFVWTPWRLWNEPCSRFFPHMLILSAHSPSHALLAEYINNSEVFCGGRVAEAPSCPKTSRPERRGITKAPPPPRRAIIDDLWLRRVPGNGGTLPAYVIILLVGRVELRRDAWRRATIHLCLFIGRPCFITTLAGGNGARTSLSLAC